MPCAIEIVYINIFIKNRCKDIEVSENNSLITGKEDADNHGFGTQIIKEISEKYDGTYSWKAEKEYFIVNSYIYLWYAFVYTARLKADFSISDQTITNFDEKLRKEVYRRFFRTASLAYLKSFYFKKFDT